MSDDLPPLMLLAWPKVCPRCRVRHLLIPMTLADYTAVLVSDLAKEVEARVLLEMVGVPR